MIIDFRKELIRLTDEKFRLTTENEVNNFFKQLIADISNVPLEHLLSEKCELVIQRSKGKINYDIFYCGKRDIASSYKTHFDADAICDVITIELQKEGFTMEKKDFSILVYLEKLV